MNPVKIVEQVEADRVTLAVTAGGTITMTGDQEGVDRWLPTVRARKAEIITALTALSKPVATPSSGWLFRFTNRDPVECYFTPSVTRTEALEVHPQAIDATPIVRMPRRSATAGEAEELRQLLSVICAEYPDDEKAEALAFALADSESALACYRAIAAEHQSPALLWNTCGSQVHSSLGHHASDSPSEVPSRRVSDR